MSMRPTQRIAFVAGLLTLAAALNSCSREKSQEGGPGNGPTVLRDAEAPELALISPLVKGGALLNYTVDGIKLVPGQGLVIALVKAGGFLPDGGPTDGGGCDPSHPDEARLGLAVSIAPERGAAEAPIKGPYVVRARPVNVPQAEADRLAAALAELLNIDAPVPVSLSARSN